MEMFEWKNDIIERAVRQISYRNNMSQADKDDLTLVLSDYLNDGINILRKWRKLKNDTEFVSGMHDEGLVVYLKAKYQANGRDLFIDYTSGGVEANMEKTPESLLKTSCKQVM
jgi:hypothetical protein